MPAAACALRGFNTMAADPGCELYNGRT